MPSIPQHTAQGITAVNDGVGRQIHRDAQFLIVSSPNQNAILRLPSGPGNSWEGQEIEGYVGANGFTLTGATSINGETTYQVPPNYYFSVLKGIGSLWIVEIVDNLGKGGLSFAQKATLSKLLAASAAALVSNPVDAADMASPPTVSKSSAHDAAFTVRKFPAVIADESTFRISGGKRWRRTVNSRLHVTQNTVAPSSAGTLRGINSSVGGWAPEAPTDGYDNSNNATVEFVTNAPIVEIELQPGTVNTPYRLIVDGRYADREGFTVASTSEQFVKFDFGAPATRSLTIETFPGQTLVGAISVGAIYAISTPSTPVYGVVRAAATGDSNTESLLMGNYSGAAKRFPFDGWPMVFAKLAGFSWMQNSALGGTGYWNENGGVPGTRSNITVQMDYWLGLEQYDVICIFAGANDAGQVPGGETALRAFARAAWVKARAAYPNALLLIGGVFGSATIINDDVPRAIADRALAAEFAAWGDKFSLFFPISPSYAAAWINGAGNTAAPTGDGGNADLYISTDGQHMNRSGHIYIGKDKMAPAYRTQLAALAALYDVT